MQEIEYIFRSLRHIVGQYVCGVCIISHQLGLLHTEGQNLLQNLLVVVLITTVTQGSVSLINLLAQFTVLCILQQRCTAGLLQREHPFSLFTLSLGFTGCPCNHRFGQTCQIFLLIDYQFKCIVICQYMIAEINGQSRQFLVDFTQTGLLFLIESSSRAFERLAVFLQQVMLFGCQLDSTGFFLFANLGHPLVQGFIQIDIVTVFRQHRSDFRLQSHQFVIGIGRCQGKKDTRYPTQDFTAIV